MAVGGIVEIFLGVAAERRSLEDVATPLSAVRRRAAETMSGIRGALPESGPSVRTTGTP